MDESSSSPRVAPYAEEILDAVATHIAESPNQGLTRRELQTHLEAIGFERPTIEAAFDQLMNRGYLYEVDNRIRVTDQSH